MIQSELKLLIVILAVIGISMLLKSVDSFINNSSFVEAQTNTTVSQIVLSTK